MILRVLAFIRPSFAEPAAAGTRLHVMMTFAPSFSGWCSGAKRRSIECARICVEHTACSSGPRGHGKRCGCSRNRSLGSGCVSCGAASRHFMAESARCPRGSVSCPRGSVSCGAVSEHFTADSVRCKRGSVSCTRGSVSCGPASEHFTADSVRCKRGSVSCTRGSISCRAASEHFTADSVRCERRRETFRNTSCGRKWTEVVMA